MPTFTCSYLLWHTTGVVFIDCLDIWNGFPCVEYRASWEHGGLSKSFACHSFPSFYGHVHPILLQWCLGVSCTHPFKALTFFSQNSIPISSQIRDVVPSYLRQVGIHQINLPVNLLYLQWFHCTYNSTLVRPHLGQRDPQCKTGIWWNEFSERKQVSLRDWSSLHIMIHWERQDCLAQRREGSEGCYQCI